MFWCTVRNHPDRGRHVTALMQVGVDNEACRGCACREELETYDAFDEGVFCRSRFWLFISYVVSFASVIAAVWVLLQGYALNDVPSVWPGAAGVFQVSTQLPYAAKFHRTRTLPALLHAGQRTLKHI